ARIERKDRASADRPMVFAARCAASEEYRRDRRGHGKGPGYAVARAAHPIRCAAFRGPRRLNRTGVFCFNRMQGEVALTGRNQEILSSIVRAYIETGEPVGSRTVSKRRKDGLSPASIRNAMADLADEGYLSQPHTSAGRLPTEKAFRYYVRSLAAGRIPTAAAQRVHAELRELESMEARIERSSHILTELTQHVGIAAAMSSGGEVLDQIELVA